MPEQNCCNRRCHGKKKERKKKGKGLAKRQTWLTKTETHYTYVLYYVRAYVHRMTKGKSCWYTYTLALARCRLARVPFPSFPPRLREVRASGNPEVSQVDRLSGFSVRWVSKADFLLLFSSAGESLYNTRTHAHIDTSVISQRRQEGREKIRVGERKKERKHYIARTYSICEKQTTMQP